MDRYVLGLAEADRTLVATVGGKAAQLGELARMEGMGVPAGFCVTTAAFGQLLAGAPGIDDLLERLAHLGQEDREAIGALSAEIRRSIETYPVPGDVAGAVIGALPHLGADAACAVRSSATAEDLPTASFAGQQDSYLNIVGPAAVLQHVSRCWASLFTERAVAYRIGNGLDHRRVRMAVIVQRMLAPQAAGVLFTADPLTSNRNVSCVEACFGLGASLASGRVNPDVFRVRDGRVIGTAVVAKRVLLQALPGGGTREVPVEPARQEQPVLTYAQVVDLAQLGRQVEAHFGLPQDIEWCLVDDEFAIVQSRPITMLFPIPPAPDHANHVYVSAGHQQMMTDAMKPLGLSFWQLTTPRPMAEAGGRLFVDVAGTLASPTGRAALLSLTRSDPLIGNALETILERDDFMAALPADVPRALPAAVSPHSLDADPALVAELIERHEASLSTLERDIRSKSGPDLLAFILDDIAELRRLLFDPESHQVFMTAMEATHWLNEKLDTWLGEERVADTLTQSVPHNVTSEMGLALLAAADVIRPHPEVVAYLRQVDGEDFLAELPTLAGGGEARDAIEEFLERYGMRGVGEIDITRPRWCERPSMLIPLILGNVRNFEPGAGERRFERGRQEAHEKEHELLARSRELPDGESKARETKHMIDRVRTFIGYREYPKYGMVRRYLIYKQALLRDAERLVQAGVLRNEEDIFYLRFEELDELVRTNRVDDRLIRRRAEEFRMQQGLTPPRVFTSEGEVVAGTYGRTGAPPGALVGLAVSAGTVEGRARVVPDLAEADFEMGDILVTVFTDPSWTPAFLSVAGLVTEVGGIMTHGAVIAREIGLPAVVGVEHATRLIGGGQHIRVNGTKGYVEIVR